MDPVQNAEAEVCPPGTVPTGCAVPINRGPLVPQGCVVVRREVMWCVGGIFVGGLLAIWLMQSLKNSR